MNKSNDLEWRRYYAIANSINTQGNEPKLLESDEINKKCGQSYIWKDDYYFWNDIDDNNLNQLLVLEIIKKAYKNKTNIDRMKQILVQNNSYNACWLKYCLKYDYEELLNQKLSWNNSDLSVDISLTDGKNKKYMLYVIKLLKKANWVLIIFN